MSLNNSIDAVTISLDINKTPSLFVLLANDGSINRMGTGAIQNDEHDMYIGVIDNGPFNKLRAMIPDDWLTLQGRYEMSDRVGPDCELTIVLRQTEGEDVALQFIYGAESDGPPSDIIDFVSSAVNLTAQWAREQKAMVEEAGRSKP